MKHTLLLQFLKSLWRVRGNFLVLALASLSWSYDHSLTISGSTPGVMTLKSVSCVVEGGKGVGSVALPVIKTPDESMLFHARVLPWAAIHPNPYFWKNQYWTFGDWYTGSDVLGTYHCKEGAENTESTTSDQVWYLATMAAGGKVTFNYIGTSVPAKSFPAHELCGGQSKSQACVSFLPMVKAQFNNLALSGRISGMIQAAYGYSVDLSYNLSTGRPSKTLNSILLKVDPRSLFQGSLPVSWFRDGEALVGANADKSPYNLAVNESFVASAAIEVPVYLGDGQYIEDPVGGKIFPETGGKKVRTYMARGAKLWKVSDLKVMSIDKVKTLNLPWMTKPLNQDDYESWPDKDYPLQAVPNGTNWPPIPPDNVLNANPTPMASCPDMFQYYALYRECADNLFKTTTQVDVGSFINYLDQLNHDLDNIDGVRDYTSYKSDGSLDKSAETEPGSDKHYDIDDLRRLNPNNVVSQDPFQATSFWMNFTEKKYCWLGMCSVGKDYESWWYDGYFKIDPSWRFDNYVTDKVDKTAQGQEYLNDMTRLFNDLKIQRDLFAFPAFSWKKGQELTCLAQAKVGAIMGNPITCPEEWLVGTGGVAKYGSLDVYAAVDMRSYQVYLDNSAKGNNDWHVFLGNPNDGGAQFETVRGMVMDGSRAPMELEHDEFWEDIVDKMYKHYIVQEWPIVFQDGNGVRYPLGTLKVRKLVHTDEQSGHNWIGNNYGGNETLNNDAPGLTDDGDTYDKKTAEYMTDKYDLNKRDEMTWSQKEDAILKIVKYIAVSEGLDLLVKAAYSYRKELWYLCQKVGLEAAIRTTAKYAIAIYRVYREYRTTMDQMREVRDASRRLKRNYRLLRATYNDIWHYYVHELDYTSIRPTNITKLMPIHLLGRADFAMWSTVSSLNDMAKGSHLLTLKFEGYCSKAFGGTPQIVFHRNEQQEISQILDANSTDVTDQQNEQLQKMKSGNPSLQEPDQVWKASNITEMFTKQVSGSGLWLENGYTRAAYNALALAEADAHTWVDLKDRMQWQYNSLASIFVNQQTGSVNTNLAEGIRRSAYITRTPVSFANPAYYPIEKELQGASGSVITCGGGTCF